MGSSTLDLRGRELGLLADMLSHLAPLPVVWLSFKMTDCVGTPMERSKRWHIAFDRPP
jgi:hypothetical protein